MIAPVLHVAHLSLVQPATPTGVDATGYATAVQPQAGKGLKNLAAEVLQRNSIRNNDAKSTEKQCNFAPSKITGKLHAETGATDVLHPLQLAATAAVELCLSHQNQQPGGHCPIKNSRGPEQLAGCTLWQLKCRGDDPARHMNH